MSDWLHPTWLMLLGAAVLPLMSGRLRQAWMVIVPAVTLVWMFMLAQGESGATELFGMTLQWFRVDALSLAFGQAFALVALIGAIYALHVEDKVQHTAAFVYVGAALGVIFAGDLITLYVFWEMMMISSVWLIWCRREPAAVAAGMRYLLMHALGGVLLLGGIILTYLETGSVHFDAVSSSGWGFYLLLIGILVNAAVPPLHAWLADAYPRATLTGAIFLCAVTTKTAVYVLARGFPGTEILIGLGVVMACYGGIYALLVNDIRRILAYQVIGQVGYMVAGVGMGTLLAMNGVVAHAFAGALYKALLFMAAGAVIHATGTSRLNDLGGLARSMPLVFAFFLVGALSISAMPLLSGFVSKTMIIEAAADERLGTVYLLMSAASAITFIAVTMRLGWFAFFDRPGSASPVQAIPLNMTAAMAITAALCFLIGVLPSQFYQVLPDVVDYHAYTIGHLLWELQLLLFAGLTFFLLREKLRPRPGITLDIDWIYRQVLTKQSLALQAAIEQLWNDFLARMQRRMLWVFESVNKHHGPQGVLARTWPTGSMVLWVAVLLAASLLVYYL